MAEDRTDRVLVLGGTGHYGREIVRALLHRDVEVRVMTRNPEAARRALGPGPELIAGDIERGDDLDAALDGVSSLAIAVSAFAPRTAHLIMKVERDATIRAIDRARSAGVEHLVYLSVYEPRSDVIRELSLGPFGDIARAKAEVEAALAETAPSRTVLGCAPSMEIFFAFRRGPLLVVPGGGPAHGLPTIAARDVGELAAQALVRRDLEGERFRLTGPEPLTFAEAARRISAATGRRLHFVAAPTLPLRIAATVTAPFNPFLQYVKGAVTLFNNFPRDLVDQVPSDHRRLRETFDFTPTGIEEEAHRRLAAGEL